MRADGPIEVGSDGEQFVLRVELATMPAGASWVFGWSAIWAGVRSLWAGSRRWAVRVRPRDADPFGAPVHEERSASWNDAWERAEEIAASISHGARPW